MADNTNNVGDNFGYNDIDDADTIDADSQGKQATRSSGPHMLADISREDRFLYEKHPECKVDLERTVMAMSEKLGDGSADPNHTTHPYISAFERCAVLSFRASQLQKGFPAYVVVPEHITDVLDIAKLELAQKKMPFIVKRTMPDGRAEYWKIKDLINNHK